MIKQNSISVFLSLFLVILLSQSKMFNFLIDTYLGRILLLVFIIVISYLNKILGVVSVLFIIILFNQYKFGVEGFVANNAIVAANTPVGAPIRRRNAVDNRTDIAENVVDNRTDADIFDKRTDLITEGFASVAAAAGPNPRVKRDRYDNATDAVDNRTDIVDARSDVVDRRSDILTEGFDIVGQETSLLRGKQSNSIPVSKRSGGKNNVDPIDNAINQFTPF
jgi:hypothetical protein